MYFLEEGVAQVEPEVLSDSEAPGPALVLPMHRCFSASSPSV